MTTSFIEKQTEGRLNDSPNFPATKWGMQDSNLGYVGLPSLRDAVFQHSPNEEAGLGAGEGWGLRAAEGQVGSSDKTS